MKNARKFVFLMFLSLELIAFYSFLFIFFQRHVQQFGGFPRSAATDPDRIFIYMKMPENQLPL